MECQSELQQQILSRYNLHVAYKKTRTGQSKFKNAAVLYNENMVANNKELIKELYSGQYIPDKYIEFKVFDPKERVIHAPRYRDKIVQHLLNNVLSPYFNARFIPDSYACIVNRGNQKAVLQLQHYMYCAETNYGSEYYVIKADIKKFFYTIDRMILKLILGKHIQCTWTYALICTIIDSSPGDLGLPLGNLTSQLFANVYLNQLDQYIKRTLRIRYYVRYADDLFCFVENKDIAARHLKSIDNFVSTTLNLKLHEKKSTILKPTNGLDGLGFKIFSHEIRLKYKTRSKINDRLRNIKIETNLNTIKEITLSINGWLNHAKLSSNWCYFEYLVERYPYITLDSDFLFQLEF